MVNPMLFLEIDKPTYWLVFAVAVKLKLTVLLLVTVQETLTFCVELVSVPAHWAWEKEKRPIKMRNFRASIINADTHLTFWFKYIYELAH